MGSRLGITELVLDSSDSSAESDDLSTDWSANLAKLGMHVLADLPLADEYTNKYQRCLI